MAVLLARRPKRLSAKPHVEWERDILLIFVVTPLKLFVSVNNTAWNALTGAQVQAYTREEQTHASFLVFTR